MLGSYGFLSQVFGQFEKHKLSVDVLASSEVSVSLTLDAKQDDNEIRSLLHGLEDIADVTEKKDMSLLTLITDVEKSSEVMATVFRVFSTQDIKVEMMSQGASKVNISFVVHSKDLEKAIMDLHDCFFEEECVVEKWSPEDEAPQTQQQRPDDESIGKLLDVIKNGVKQDVNKKEEVKA